MDRGAGVSFSSSVPGKAEIARRFLPVGGHFTEIWPLRWRKCGWHITPNGVICHKTMIVLAAETVVAYEWQTRRWPRASGLHTCGGCGFTWIFCQKYRHPPREEASMAP